MEVRVKTIQMPIDEITCKDLYVVEMYVLSTNPFSGFNFGNLHQWNIGKVWNFGTPSRIWRLALL